MADAPETTRSPDGTITVPAPHDPAAGLRIGAYKVLRELGHGGMGAVYLAARADDQYQKRVAIKVVKAGAFGEDAIRHFRRERQILASLDHPNIARLLDGGATDEGLPYLVMEHVEGQPIGRYCDTNRLPTAERLRLFRAVCSAVQYAHRNLVVHRDIKPGNVLVAADGVPKLLDFGVAKLLNPELSGEPATATGLAMTPEYASPEQARGEPITTASDVYSLGVLLYELLTGQRPYRIKSRQALDVLRAVCEEEPEKPSTAVARTTPVTTAEGTNAPATTAEVVSAARAATPDKLRRRLRGDLDNIVMMALRKEPQQRYPSVEALSEDIRRHLEGLPVVARQPTLGYLTGKFVRRNRGAVLAALTIAGLILSFGVTATLQSRQIARERDQAARERDKAQKVSEFLASLFKASKPSEAQGKPVTARDILDRGTGKIATQLADQPEVRATLLYTIGDVYMALGANDRARGLLEEALAERRRLFPGDHPDTAVSLASLGLLYEIQDDQPRAESLYRESLAMRRRLFGEGHPEVARSLEALANLLNDKGDPATAEPMLRESLAIHRKAFAADDRRVLASMTNLAVVLSARGRHAEAESLFRDVLAARRRAGGETPALGVALENVGNVLFEQRRFPEAESFHRESLEVRRRLFGADDWRVGMQLVNVGAVLSATGRCGEGEGLLREGLSVLRKSMGEDHVLTATAKSRLGGCLVEGGMYAEAEPLLLAGYASLLRKRPVDKETRDARGRLAHLYQAWGKPEKADEYGRAASGS
jgi:serine/threonine-protein kinase